MVELGAERPEHMHAHVCVCVCVCLCLVVCCTEVVTDWQDVASQGNGRVRMWLHEVEKSLLQLFEHSL